MDRDKLNKKAEEQANYSTHWSWGDRKDCFISGADWLMQQPLSERLTEEEKDRIRGLLNYIGENAHDSEVLAMQNELTSIFGSDLFKEK